MANYSFTFKDDSLSHHGIEGQKWGVRNGPPYPLDSGGHSAAEKRAMNRENKKNYKILKNEKKINKKYGYSLGNGISSSVKKKLEDNKEKITSLYKDRNAESRYMLDFEQSTIYRDCAKEDVETYGNKMNWSNDDKRDMLSLYFFDDLGQSIFDEWQNGAFDCSKPTEKQNKEYLDCFNKSQKAYNELNNIYYNIAEEALGKYSDAKVMIGNGRTRTAKDLLKVSLELYADYSLFKNEYDATLEPDETYFNSFGTNQEIKDWINNQFRD